MTVAVIGAGLQGSLAAIELAQRGHDVIVFERAAQSLTRASRWNEGKIHLGYLFANDLSLRSARTLIDGATRFAPLLSRYLERDLAFIPRSDGFIYGVHRASLVGPDEIGAHLGRVHAMVSDALAESGRDYLGARSMVLPASVPVAARGLDPHHVSAAFETDERSIDAHALADAVGQRLAAEPRAALRLDHDIRAVERLDNGGFALDDAHGRRHGPFAHVVNAAWEQRLALDATLGYRPSVRWMHRYKLALHVAIDDQRAAVPSVTIVLGPFGDVVNFDNRKLYLSWYPVARLSSSQGLVPPAMDAEVDAARRDGVAAAMTHRLGEIVPALATPELPLGKARLAGGYIFAWGETDINDPGSGLHNRYDIGIHSDRGYHSIDTGKLTMAPLNAARLGERIGDAPAL